MSTYRMSLIVEVDDELLAAHDGRAAPPPNEIREWYGGDLERAIDQGIVSIEHEPIEDIEPIRDEAGE